MKKKPKIGLNDVQVSTRLLHEELTSDQEVFCRYTYKYAGKYVIPTFEQWEIGFLTEKDPQRELMFWMAISAYMKQLEETDPMRARRLVTQWCTGRCHHQLERRISRAAGGTAESYLAEAKQDLGIS